MTAFEVKYRSGSKVNRVVVSASDREAAGKTFASSYPRIPPSDVVSMVVIGDDISKERDRQIAAQYERSGFRVAKGTLRSPSASGEHAGVTFTHTAVGGGGDNVGGSFAFPTSSWAAVCVASALPGEFSITRKRDIDSFFRRIGFSIEANTGDAKFDSEFALDGTTREYLQALFSDARNRDLVRELFALGFDRVELRDGKAAAGKSAARELLDLSVVTGAVERLASLRAPPGAAEATMHAGLGARKIKAGFMAIAIVATLYLLWELATTQTVVGGWWGIALREWPLIALAYITLAAVTFALLRGRLGAHLGMKYMVIGIAIVVAAGLAAVVNANEQLDESIPTFHEARVIDKYTTGRTYRHHVRLQSWRPDLEEVDVTTLPGIYARLQAGQTVTVATRAGRFGIEWVDYLQPPAAGAAVGPTRATSPVTDPRRRQAFELHRAGKWAQAIAAYDILLRENERDAELAYWRGMAQWKLNRVDEALEDFRRVIEWDPTNFDANVNADRILSAQHRWDEILEMWDRYISRMPTKAEAYFERGGTQYHKGNVAASQADAAEACRLGKSEACVWAERLKGK